MVRGPIKQVCNPYICTSFKNCNINNKFSYPYCFIPFLDPQIDGENLSFDENFALNLLNLMQDGMNFAEIEYLCSMNFKIL